MLKLYAGTDGRRVLTAALAALLCALPLLAGSRVRQSGGEEKSPACARGPCFEVRRVNSCEGENCLEAVRTEGCEESPCFALKPAPKCEGDNCFQVFSVAGRPRLNSRPKMRTGQTKRDRNRTLAVLDGDSGNRPASEVARTVEHVDSCKAAGTCFEIKQAKGCKVPPCFAAVKKDKCEGRGCFAIKTF